MEFAVELLALMMVTSAGCIFALLYGKQDITPTEIALFFVLYFFSFAAAVCGICFGLICLL